MKIPNLKDMLKLDYQPRLVILENRIIWYNRSVCVVDDPSLIDYFGDYLLRDALGKEPHKTYLLKVERNRIQVVAEEVRPSQVDRIIKKHLKANRDSLTPVKISREAVKPKAKIPFEGYAVRVPDEPNRVYLVYKKQFEYLEELAEGRGGIRWDKKLYHLLFYKGDLFRGFTEVASIGYFAPSDFKGNIDDLFNS